MVSDPIIFGDGEQTRDFIYVGDVVEANLRAASVPVQVGGVYNIASGRPTSLNQVVRAVSTLLGSTISTRPRRRASGRYPALTGGRYPRRG